MGRVTSQETTIVPTTRRSMAPRLWANPTPTTALTAMWVVDTGSPCGLWGPLEGELQLGAGSEINGI